MEQGRYVGDTVKITNSLGEEIHVRHGRGTYTYANSCFQYTGEWVCGVKHGHGVLSIGRDLDAASECAPGAPVAGAHSVYEGEFVHGEMSGAGLKRWSDGASYSGQFVAGEMHGEGVWHGGGGVKYEGAFKHNARSGFGTLSDEHVEHQGEFFQGKKHGEGHSKWHAEGSEHRGQWSNDLRVGPGMEHLPDGSTFEGQFANDLREGEGHFTHAPSGIEVRVAKPASDSALLPGSPTLPPDASPRTSSAAAAREKRSKASASSDGLASPTAAAAAASAAGGDPPTAAKAKPSSGKLSKKKAEEAARLAAEAAEAARYRASLTQGVVELDDGRTVAVIDEGQVVTVQPGHQLPPFFVCACTPTMTKGSSASSGEGSSGGSEVCASEQGRVWQFTLRAVGGAAAAAAGSGATQAPTQRGGNDEGAPMSARARAAAQAAAEALEVEEPPVAAFCTCPGANNPPHTTEGGDDADAAAAAAAAAAAVEASAAAAAAAAALEESKKKKASTSKPSSSSSKSRRRSLASSASSDVPPLGPPPPFVCTGACTPLIEGTLSDRSGWCVRFLRREVRGFVHLGDPGVWLSGACTPALQMEIVVEDVTTGVEEEEDAAAAAEEASEDATSTETSLPAVGAASRTIAFKRLPPTTIRLLVAGQLPKKKKKPLAKPTAAPAATTAAAGTGATTPKDRAQTPSSSSS